MRPQIDFLKSVFPQENIFRDFQAWYLALRQIILTGNVPLAERLTKNHHLHMLFNAFLQEMKYWVIAGIKTSRSLFDAFASTVRTGAHVGMGLPTVKRITEAHRRRVTVQSKVGEGTTFQLSLPAARPS